MPLIDLVVADETEAAAVGEASSPTTVFQGIEAKHIDEVKLAKLSLILDGLPITTVRVVEIVKSFAQLYESSEDGPWVSRVPDQLVAALASVDEGRCTEVAKDWAGQEEFRSDGWNEAEVAQFLRSLRELCKVVKAEGKALLMWCSL